MVQETNQKVVKGQIPPIPETLVSAGHLFEGQISLVDDEANTFNADCFVFKKAPGQELSNWTYVDVPQVIMIKK